MIKLRYAIFTNFRGLRNVRIDFSTKDDKPLTVIRAANYTGKTTLLYGLTWGLFGDAGLPVAPRRRDTYRLHPIDWDVDTDGNEVNVEVEVGLTVFDETTGLPTDYNLVRRGAEIISPDGWRPQETTYDLIRLDPQGDHRVLDPDRIMDRVLLPAAKKDIFFVDGDARVNQYFADSDEDIRSNVRDAVRHLLSLDVVESANSRMVDVLRGINSRVRDETVGTKAEGVAEALEKARARLSQVTLEQQDAEADHKQSSSDMVKMEKLRESALMAGGDEAEQIQKQLDKANDRRRAAAERIPQANAQMRNFVNAHELYEQLAIASMATACEVYETLRTERKIPNIVPGLIRDRLQAQVCICGADLSPGTPAHEHLQKELTEVETHSESRSLLGRLADSGRVALQAGGSGIWKIGANSALSEWLEAGNSIERENDEIDRLEHQVSKRATAREDLKIANSNLTRAKEGERENRRRVQRAGLDVEHLTKEVSAFETELNTLIRKAGNFAKLRAERQAAEDVKRVISASVEVLLGDTIDEVSCRMNELFMRMIASSPEPEAADAKGVVQQVHLTRDCQIEAYGPGGRKLMPRTDLSGAQQQSLTVALIMSLIEISGETSPTVIDTPLGRTSGPVRKEFLAETLELERLRARPADSKEIVPQKVLIMTPNEIAGVENMLDEAAGCAWTLSNTQHYPTQLVNDPGTKHREILACGCGPRETDYCSVCQRVEWK